jgi:hypothetical protein
LGLCLGALIGLTQVVLREAWLTVVDGYRTGRQLIISRPVTVLGRGDHLPLPFLGPGNRDLEIEHCRITRQANGSFLLEDLQSRLGVFVNQQRVQGSRELASGDMIKLGPNHIRFQESRRRGGTAVTNSVAGAAGGGSKIPPPPPPPPPPRRPATDSLPNSASASGPASASGSASPSGPASPSPLVNASPANAPAVKPPSGRPPPPGSQPPGANSGR